jgi:hypothetical protein
MLSADQLQRLKQLLAESEALHHKIMAKMDDPRFDVLEVWARKESLDAAIGAFLRDALLR